ncbi:glycosyltransferase family 4 protein [Nodosilinea sp. PGN35]|uniref:glycosyltransferase family 4 protein n=1 Tax=Nodosilinea sp. PGN35 TaxID=3020489 RepID=UPI0023B2C989|nr:glycosyltransferase family 4 protein [Nodosilinea sp. TSF1-S3]MDF0366865.1 glycosyltransferase family 4 protein [Nodosilinea sp. TSF1-S3]
MSAEALPAAVAIVHEWLVSRAGSEKVVEQLLAVCPGADVFSLVQFLEPEAASLMPPGTRVQTSFLQNLPGARRHFRQYLPLMPLAIEQFDLSAYDLVLSSNHAVAKGVLTRPHQLHVSYVHTPIRYAWDLQQQYLQQAGLTKGIKSALTRLILHYLRLWDLAAAHRVDCFVANSRYVARRVWKTYRRPATVIYPPVAIDRFRWQQPRDDFYLTVSRCVPYKRVDLTVAAFNRLGWPLVVIGDGPALADLQRAAKPNITFLRNPPDAVVSDHMERCRGFVFPAEEDFGITVVEAQAAGAPVIAYGHGGCAETVLPGKTGVLFRQQTVDHVVQAVQHFELHRGEFGAEAIRRQAETFSESRFRREITAYLADKWLKFQQGNELE